MILSQTGAFLQRQRKTRTTAVPPAAQQIGLCGTGRQCFRRAGSFGCVLPAMVVCFFGIPPEFYRHGIPFY
jgi:hypothetical protein